MKKDLIDLAYELVFKKLSKKNTKKEAPSITFTEICDKLMEELNYSESTFQDMLGSIYSDMLQDGRFVFLGNNKWTLRELNDLEFLNKNRSSLYSYDTSIVVQESYDEESLPTSMINEDNEVYEENENEISRDQFDSNNDSDYTINNSDNNSMKFDYDDESEIE